MEKLKKSMHAAKKSQGVGYWAQSGETPIKDFVENHPAFKRLVDENNHLTSADVLYKNYWGYEVAPTKLRSVVYAFIAAAEKAEAAAEKESEVAEARRQCNMYALFEDAMSFSKVKKAKIDLEKKEKELAAAQKISKSVNKFLLKEFFACNGSQPLLPTTTAAKKAEERNKAQAKRSEEYRYREHVRLRVIHKVLQDKEDCVQDMLVAFLKDDRAAFKDAFNNLEFFTISDFNDSNECLSTQYSFGLANIDELSVLLHECLDRKLQLTDEHDPLKCVSSLLQNYVEASVTVVDDYLIKANDLSEMNQSLDWSYREDGEKKKINAFVSDAFNRSKRELKSEVKQLKKNIKVGHNKAVLLSKWQSLSPMSKGFIACSKSRYEYAVSWCKAWVSFLAGDDGQTQALAQNTDKLEKAKEDLQHIKQAEGIYSGFYYTYGLQAILQQRFSEASNMNRAIYAKPLEDNFEERCRSFISPVWCAIGVPLEFLWNKAKFFMNKFLAFLGFGKKAGSGCGFVAPDPGPEPPTQTSVSATDPLYQASLPKGPSGAK